MSSGGGSNRRGVPISSVPKNPNINNMDSLLNDIYVRYVAVNDDDFEKYYKVIDDIFGKLHNKMKEKNPYYNKYSSQAQFAGSHPDRLRINKPDEFDIDIVIDHPLSINTDRINPHSSDLTLAPKDPGFIQIKVKDRSYTNDWTTDKTFFEWKDRNDFLLGSSFKNWFSNLVDAALDCFVDKQISKYPVFKVDGVYYNIKKDEREECPAVTLYIENPKDNFKLDLDLVPALRFPISRWPISNDYRDLPPVCKKSDKKYWIAVPKISKQANYYDYGRDRSWGISMHEHESTLMHDSNNIKQAVRFMKKMRDSQNMTKITSYFIKTCLFWELFEHQNDQAYFEQSPTILFKLMLKRFHGYLRQKKIPCFWHKNNNLIDHLSYYEAQEYARIVENLLEVFDRPFQYRHVAKYLLTKDEFLEYNLNYLHI